MSLSAFVVVLLAAFVVAVPTHYPSLLSKRTSSATCYTNLAKLDLPSGQSVLTPPPGNPAPSFVMIGIGYQNYSCNSTGGYTLKGSTSDLYDLSCLSETNYTAFETFQDYAYSVWSTQNTLVPIKQIVPKRLGESFQNLENLTVWDFRSYSALNRSDAFVVADEVGSLESNTSSLSWLQFNAVNGSLANTIYRTDTRGGQPPASCKPGSGIILVDYVAKYWMFGGNVTLSNSTMLNNTMPNNTMPNNTMPNNTMPNNTMPNNTMPNNTMPNNTMPNNTMPNNTMPNNTMPNNTMPNNTMPNNTISNNTTSNSTLSNNTFIDNTW